jgi:hypothetical protein
VSYNETLPIIIKPKHPKKGGNTRNKMEGPMSKKTKEAPKRVNHKGNIKCPNPLLSQEAYQIRKGDSKHQVPKPPPLPQKHIK